MGIFSRALGSLAFLISLLTALHAHAGEVAVAVATNFLAPLESMQPVFEHESGHGMRISSGSSGQIYSQIRQGAPYDVFLSADEERPRLLEEAGSGVTGTRFTYAVGRLVLWGPGVDGIEDGPEVLARTDYRKLAIANPDLAPYGLAARELLMNLGLWDRLGTRIVMGENIARTYALVHTGNAELGFVALSQRLASGNPDTTDYWVVPDGLHTPVMQQAILLVRGQNNPAAIAFIEFLKSETARKMITDAGYSLAE